MPHFAPIYRRRFLATAGLAAGLLALCAQAPAEDARVATRPNVLVIQPDQHRAMTLGAAGDRQASTPNLDRLAAQGIRFSNAASCSPVCSPFRGTMQTGLYCHAHGVVLNGIPLDGELTGFAQLFVEAGYVTGYIGKWHLEGGLRAQGTGGYVPEDRRFGWQEWLGYETGHEYFDVWRCNRNGDKVSVKGYDWEPTWHTDVMLDFARRHRDAGRPWLYYLAYGPPHKPEQCPRKYLEMFPQDKIQLPPDLLDGFSGKAMEAILRSWQVYYAQVAAIDHEIGRLVEGLKQLDVDDNTIIVYCSDHGDRLGSHWDQRDGLKRLRGKGQPYATAFRIPLIVRWPKRIRPRQVCDALVGSVDLTPTILDLAGLDVPAAMQGDSMAGWCLAGDGPNNEAVYLGLGRGQKMWRAVWDGRHVFSEGSIRVFYDHKNDPHEMHNLIDSTRPQDRKTARILREKLIELATKTEDPAVHALRQISSD